MLGREVVEHQQMLDVVGDLDDRLRKLRAISRLERLDHVQRVAFVLGVPDLGERFLRARVRRFRQRGKHVRDLVEPASLRTGLGKHLAQRAPEPERAVADRQHRRPHAAAFAFA